MGRYPGLARDSLRPLGDEQHLVQSINDILSTRPGSRVMRRTYGSDLPRLIDAPINGETQIDLIAATAEAIDLWEPRFALRRVELAEVAAGKLTLVLTGEVGGTEAVLRSEVLA
jgi:phage baseplate assembly protein W